jgi:hypothetical protein
VNPNDKHLFNLLKTGITSTFSKEYPTAGGIEQWKGADIVAFQEDLFSKVKARVSEKWFYTYFKNEAHKLPRIDMLNLLSAYTGYTNWNEFKAKNSNPVLLQGKKGAIQKYRAFLLLIPLLAVAAFYWPGEHNFHFCLVDEDKNEAITSVVDVKILQKGQSPLYLKTDSLGCFTFQTKEKTIQFVVQSPYHKTDTIARHIDTKNSPVVKLRTDDYALMLRYYSNGNKTDLQKRKQQLQQLIAEDAQIYQLYSQNLGIELYSKEEFINKLTVPTSSLKNIKILDKAYKNGKIIKLKFMVK